MKYIIVTLFVLMVLTGCNPEKAATRKLLKADRKSRTVLADWCSRLYPPVALIKDSISYFPGASELVYVSIDCDTVVEVDKSTSVIKLPCPIAARVDTLIIYKEKHLVNSAEIEKVKEDLIGANLLYEHERKMKRLFFLIALVLFIYTLLRLFSR